MSSVLYKNVAVIVAHPDDETLWVGGMMLLHPHWKWTVVCLSRASDINRAPRFYEAMKIYNAEGIMGNLNDGPKQRPMQEEVVENAILNLLPKWHYNLVITHDPSGEYTKHLRHEEISKAVISLWNFGKINTTELWTFAYEDGYGRYSPRALTAATLIQPLTHDIWHKKLNIITQTYGFEKESWEAKATPKIESFWHFATPDDAMKWFTKKESEKKRR